MSAARDGTVKLWDSRSTKKCTHLLQAHNAKLNAVSFSKNDISLLTSGRDSNLRLWDIRSLNNSTTTLPDVGKNGLITQFNEHTCQGYNLSASFFNNEQNIITGSEDRIIYIYDIKTNKVAKRLEGHSSVIHLLNCTEQLPLTIISSSIDSCSIYCWSPKSNELQTSNTQQEQITQSREEVYVQQHRSAVEALMKKHGDQYAFFFCFKVLT